MKRFLLAAAALAALVPSLASAQDRGDFRRRGGEGRDPVQNAQPGGRAGGERPSFRGRGVLVDPGQRGPGAQASPQAQPEARSFDRGQRGDGYGGRRDFGQRGPGGQAAPQVQPDARSFDRGQRGDGYGGRRDFGQRNEERRFDNRPGDGRGFEGRRGDDRRFDNRRGFEDRRFSYRGRAYPQVRAAPYRWPGGAYRSYAWRPRMVLPRSFFLPDYFIGNYYDYGFGAPAPGTEWIRVGDDALLVDIYTGEIIDVAPGVFYW